MENDKLAKFIPPPPLQNEEPVTVFSVNVNMLERPDIRDWGARMIREPLVRIESVRAILRPDGTAEVIDDFSLTRNTFIRPGGWFHTFPEAVSMANQAIVEIEGGQESAQSPHPADLDGAEPGIRTPSPQEEKATALFTESVLESVALTQRIGRARDAMEIRDYHGVIAALRKENP